MTERLNRDKRYTENFDSMFVTQDRRQMAILGRDFHYVFEAPHDLLRLVNSDLHGEMTARFSQFLVELDDTVSGDFTVFLRVRGNSYTPDQLAMAKELGMFKDEKGRVLLTGTLRGKRFDASDVASANATTTRLNSRYSVTVRERPSPGTVRTRAVLSPITKAADGVLMIATIPLIPFFAVVAVGSCSACR